MSCIIGGKSLIMQEKARSLGGRIEEDPREAKGA